MPSRSSSSCANGALLLLFSLLLHSASALLVAAVVTTRCSQPVARSAQPFLQLAFDGSSGHPATLAAAVTPIRRGPLLRTMILGGVVLGCGLAAPAFAADAPCIDVDSATAKDLEGLKGVGPVMSKRIIEYRKNERTSATKDGRQTWNYGNWATLMKVEGVSQQICTNNIAQVCFGGKVQKACPMPK